MYMYSTLLVYCILHTLLLRKAISDVLGGSAVHIMYMSFELNIDNVHVYMYMYICLVL